MKQNRKILIIENQKSQFEEIVEHLSKIDIKDNRDNKDYEGYEVYPNEEDFVSFIDNVRVWVNEKYDSENNKEYREKALSNIRDKINQNKIELIIMDHILGGAHHCLTGIDLAYVINKKRKLKGKNYLPVLFLSVSEDNNKIRLEGDTKNKKMGYKQYMEEITTSSLNKEQKDTLSFWVHKGYFGENILDGDYFEKNVLPKIKKLLEKSERQIFMEAFKKIISTLASFEKEIKEKLEIINQELETDPNLYFKLKDKFKDMIIKNPDGKKFIYIFKQKLLEEPYK